MPDDSNDLGEGTSSAASSSASSQHVNDRSQILAQATRFLTSANISESASDDDKREFLRSKGLTEEEISRAFQDAKSPAEGLHARHASAHSSSHGDMDPFELAARQFDDPINAEAIAPPPKSYPNSPLALYYDAPSSQTSQLPRADQHVPGAQPVSPLTRYQVLLQFFRTLSYVMMLGGGLTAILVSAYRAYILPKITAMFDARSIVLKHHIVLFDKLRSNVASLATYVPVQHSRIGLDDTAATSGATSPLKGVLKKVHFHDELAELTTTAQGDSDKEGVKSTQHGSDAQTTVEKVVMPGTDVVVDAKTPLSGAVPSLGSADEAATEEEETAEAVATKLEPIDLMTPIRESMARLAATLRSDLSGNAPAAVAADATSSGSSSTSTRPARVASVADSGSVSDEWEDDDEGDMDNSEDDDDGLEFDPYGAYQKKHKHTQSSSTATSATSGSGSASLAGLRTALVSLNAEISTHAFSATSSSSFGHSGGTFRFGSGTTDADASTNGSGKGVEGPKAGDLAQVKAEIRSLKGLLLSRRNFPSYCARPPPLPPATAGMEGRTPSAVV